MLQNHLRGPSYPVCDLCRHFTKLTGPCAYTLHSNPIPQQMVQMAFCALSHTFHEQVTNVSQHVLVILLWGILTSPLTSMVIDLCLVIDRCHLCTAGTPQHRGERWGTPHPVRQLIFAQTIKPISLTTASGGSSFIKRAILSTPIGQIGTGCG